jgi:hypothetical protein
MRWKRRKRSALKAAVVAAIALAAASVAAAGCFTHQCDATNASFDGGRMVGPNTYETNAYDEPWINYPPNVTLTVDFSAAAGVPRRILDVKPSIGVSQLPNGTNFTGGFGGVVEFNNWTTTSFRAINSTCASYYARFIVYFEPLEAGADADAGADAFDEAAAGPSD